MHFPPCSSSYTENTNNPSLWCTQNASKLHTICKLIEHVFSVLRRTALSLLWKQAVKLRSEGRPRCSQGGKVATAKAQDHQDHRRSQQEAPSCSGEPSHKLQHHLNGALSSGTNQHLELFRHDVPSKTQRRFVSYLPNCLLTLRLICDAGTWLS